jgi:tetratricopeptide (TPR) repeat protein
MRKPFAQIIFAVSLAAGAALVTPSLAADAPQKVSPAVGKPLSQAAAAMKTNDFATALTHVKEAQAASTHTPFDDYTINQFLGNIYIGQKDFKGAETAFEAMASSPALPPADKSGVLITVVQLAVNNQDWTAVMQYADELSAAGPLPDNVVEPVAVAYFNSGKLDKALALAKQGIATAQAAGKAPAQSLMDIVTRSQLKSNDTAGAAKTLEGLAQTYGEPNDWAQLIDLSFGTLKNLNDLQALYLYRLRVITNATTSVDDYAIMANITTKAGYPGETVAFLEHGMSQGTVKAGDKAGAQLATARTKAAEDTRGLPAFAAQAKARKSGDFDVKLAEAYYGYARYAEAEEAARRAISKGGVKDQGEAEMVLGMALAGEGKSADAADAFSHVGGGANMQGIAHLWTLYAQRKYGATPVAH